MKILKLTDKQSALLEKTLCKLMDAICEGDMTGEEHTLSSAGLNLKGREWKMLSRVWFNVAKLEGIAE